MTIESDDNQWWLGLQWQELELSSEALLKIAELIANPPKPSQQLRNAAERYINRINYKGKSK